MTTLTDHVALFIDGQWQQPHSTARIEVRSANTERQIGSAPDPDDIDMDLAVAAARRAFDDPAGWSRWIPSDRAKVLHAFADALDKRATQIAELVSDENGMPITVSSFAEAQFPGTRYRQIFDEGGYLLAVRVDDDVAR